MDTTDTQQPGPLDSSQTFFNQVVQVKSVTPNITNNYPLKRRKKTKRVKYDLGSSPGPDIWGMRCRLRREQLGFSQRKLCDKTGLDRTYIIGFENGRYKDPSASVIMRICKALKISINHFIGDKRIPEQLVLSKQQKIILECFSRLSTYDANSIYHIMKALGARPILRTNRILITHPTPHPNIRQKRYTKEERATAVETIKTRNLSIKDAIAELDIPGPTLRYWLKGRAGMLSGSHIGKHMNATPESLE